MTTQELLNYYSNLLIKQYRGKPKAVAEIQALVKLLVMDQLPTKVRDAYDVNTAVGVQLDVLGKYAGVVRHGYDLSGAVSLSDSDFRQLIKLAIIQNANGSSLADIQNLLQIFFPGIVYVFDYKAMRISYFFEAAIGTSTLAEFVVKQGLLPRPMGVQLSTLVYAPSLNVFFGMRTYVTPPFHASPFATYSSYITTNPWLNYSYGVIP